MGWLENSRSGARVRLAPRMLVGRSPQADLRIDATCISGEHAIVAWNGEGWRVRDLGSSNGTALDGAPLTCRRDHPLKQGATLAFGQANERWVLVDAGAPEAQGLGPGGACALPADGVLSLPDDVAPVASVYHEDGQWWLQRDGEPAVVGDRSTVVVGDEVWVLRLPIPRQDTSTHVASRRLADFTLELAVSRDEEKIEVRLLRPSHRIVLETRGHHYLMVLLARHALEQRGAGVARAESGWLDPADLVDMLKISRASLNVYIHRIRRQVQDAGIFDGRDIIQRMTGTHELRLAPIPIRVVPLARD